MRIAVDFDQTIFDKRKGRPIEGAAQRLSEYMDAGHEVTIFTTRPDYDYSSVVCILDAHCIPYDRVICGKPGYDLLIDDKAERFVGWQHDYLK